MLTLLSTLFGLLGSLLPSIVNIFQKKLDYSHEIELKKLEYGAAREGILAQQAMAEIRADVYEGQSIREHDSDIEYSGFWADVRASIRPVITYVFFIVFIGIKLAAFSIMVDKGVPPMDLLLLVWDVETMAIFSAIVGFWFGSRAIQKFSDAYYRDIPPAPMAVPIPIPMPMLPNNDSSTGTTTSNVVTKPNKPKKKAVRPLSDK